MTGGWDGTAPLKSTEVSDDQGYTWFTIPSATLPTERYGLKAATLNNRIFLFGKN